MKKNLIRQYLFDYRLNHCSLTYYTERWYLERSDDPYWKEELRVLKHLLVLKDLGLISMNRCLNHCGTKIYRPKLIKDAKEKFLKSYYSIPRNVYTKLDWI